MKIKEVRRVNNLNIIDKLIVYISLWIFKRKIKNKLSI